MSREYAKNKQLQKLVDKYKIDPNNSEAITTIGRDTFKSYIDFMRYVDAGVYIENMVNAKTSEKANSGVVPEYRYTVDEIKDYEYKSQDSLLDLVEAVTYVYHKMLHQDIPSGCVKIARASEGEYHDLFQKIYRKYWDTNYKIISDTKLYPKEWLQIQFFGSDEDLCNMTDDEKRYKSIGKIHIISCLEFDTSHYDISTYDAIYSICKHVMSNRFMIYVLKNYSIDKLRTYNMPVFRKSGKTDKTLKQLLECLKKYVIAKPVISLIGLIYDPDNEKTDFKYWLKSPKNLIIYNENFDQYADKDDISEGGGNGFMRKYRSDSRKNNITGHMPSNVEAARAVKKAAVFGIPTGILPDVKEYKKYKKIIDDSIKQISDHINTHKEIENIIWAIGIDGKIGVGIFKDTPGIELIRTDITKGVKKLVTTMNYIGKLVKKSDMDYHGSRLDE